MKSGASNRLVHVSTLNRHQVLLLIVDHLLNRKPPTPIQPLDCNELGTCPTTPRVCGVLVPAATTTTLNSQYSSVSSHHNSQARIIHVQTAGGGGGGEQTCKPLVINGCVWPMVRVGDDCKPAIDCPPGSESQKFRP